MNFRILILSFVLVGTWACENTQLDQPTEGEEQMVIIEPTTLPASAAEFEQAFHGGSEREWRAMSFTLAGFSGFQDCRLDDMMIINNDGTYRYDGGSTLCGAEDDQRIKTGTWEVINDGRNIVFDAGTVNEYTADVTGIENDMLAVSGQYIGLAIRGIYQVN